MQVLDPTKETALEKKQETRKTNADFSAMLDCMIKEVFCLVS